MASRAFPSFPPGTGTAKGSGRWLRGATDSPAVFHPTGATEHKPSPAQSSPVQSSPAKPVDAVWGTCSRRDGSDGLGLIPKTAHGSVRQAAARAHALEVLHERLLVSDSRAGGEIWQAVAPALRRSVARGLTVPDSHLVETAIEDAVLAYIRAPARFRPRAGSLVGWLRTIARHDLQDALRHAGRVSAHEGPAGLDPWERVLAKPSVADISACLEQRAARVAVRRGLADRLERLTDTAAQRAFFAAFLREAPIEDQARALGVSGSVREVGRSIRRLLQKFRQRAIRAGFRQRGRG